MSYFPEAPSSEVLSEYDEACSCRSVHIHMDNMMARIAQAWAMEHTPIGVQQDNAPPLTPPTSPSQCSVDIQTEPQPQSKPQPQPYAALPVAQHEVSNTQPPKNVPWNMQYRDQAQFKTNASPSLQPPPILFPHGQESPSPRQEAIQGGNRPITSTHTRGKKRKQVRFAICGNEPDDMEAGAALEEPEFLTRRRRVNRNILKTGVLTTNFMDPGDVNMVDAPTMPVSNEMAGVQPHPPQPYQPLHCIQPLQHPQPLQPQPQQPVQAPQNPQTQDGFGGFNNYDQGFSKAPANSVVESLLERLHAMSLVNYPHLNLHLPEITQAISNLGRRNWSSPLIMNKLSAFAAPVDSNQAVAYHRDVLSLLLKMGINDSTEQWKIMNIFRRSPEIYQTIYNFFSTNTSEVHCHPADHDYYDQLLWHRWMLNTQAESIRNAGSKYANENLAGLSKAFDNKLTEVLAMEEKVQRLIDSYELSQQIPVTVVPEIEMNDYDQRKGKRPSHERSKHEDEQYKKHKQGKRSRRDSDANDKNQQQNRGPKRHRRSESNGSEGYARKPYDEDNRKEKRRSESTRRSPLGERDDSYEKHSRNQKKQKQERNEKGNSEGNERDRSRDHYEKHKEKRRRNRLTEGGPRNKNPYSR